MSTHTSIEWTELSWNPTTGCTKISPGCENCYAETMARRLKAMGLKGYENGFTLTLQPDRLDEPLSRKKSSMYFVNSMSDLFHPDVPNLYIEKVLSVISNANWHTFQVLTKRAKRMAQFFKNKTIPSNLWVGVTAENRKHGLPRIEHLRHICASTRFVSMEPLIEDLGPIDLSGINWVIVGGESGIKARPMKPEWAISIKDQCRKQGSIFFFKQWGLWGSDGIKRSKKVNGRLLLGRIWDHKPQPHNIKEHAEPVSTRDRKRRATVVLA
jgi:protein gp37